MHSKMNCKNWGYFSEYWWEKNTKLYLTFFKIGIYSIYNIGFKDYPVKYSLMTPLLIKVSIIYG